MLSIVCGSLCQEFFRCGNTGIDAFDERPLKEGFYLEREYCPPRGARYRLFPLNVVKFFLGVEVHSVSDFEIVPGGRVLELCNSNKSFFSARSITAIRSEYYVKFI